MKQILSTLCFIILTCPLIAQVYGEEVVHWDFSEGIPDDWVNESESGIGIWEYRGPDTDPDVTICSRGSCGEASDPIASMTQENGFVIFDSNYWDDEIGPCGNLGSGVDPGPHHAELITESLDLTDHSAVVITWQQAYKFHQAETTVQISVDGGIEYDTLHVNPSAQGTTSPPVEWVSVNITELAAGQPDVRFKFDFNGLYYWWALDDIVVYTPLDNDLLIGTPKYTLFDGLLSPEGFGDMEYDAYPSIMIPPFNFSAQATNIGGLNQTGVALTVKVRKNGTTVIYEQATDTTTLAAGTTTTYNIVNPYTPSAEIAEYEILYELSQTQEDESPLNNFTELDYSITEFTYSRDEGEMDDRYVPTGILDSLEYAVGNVFESRMAGLECHSISVAFADSSDINAPVYGIIYDLQRDTIYAQTDTYYINSFDLNSPGDEKIITLPLIEPLITADTTLYLVMVAQQDSLQKMSIARSGDAPVQSSLVYFPTTNGLYYMLKSPVVRMNLFPAGSMPGCTDEVAMNYDPEATMDDQSCQYAGCTNPIALNYDPNATFDDGTCLVEGCTDPEAQNYDPDATSDDGTCEYPGCTDPLANNFDADANFDDGSCTYNQAVFIVDVMEGCAPLGVIITNQTEVQVEGECFWELGGGDVFLECDQQFGHFYDDPGEYTITYVYTIGEFTSEFQIGPIIVHEPPAPPVAEYDSENNILSCTGCDGALDIEWYLNGYLEEGENSASWSPLDNGLYAVEVTDTNGCSAISEEIVVIVTSVEGLQVHESLLVYPNPASDFVIFESSLDQFYLDLYSSTGQLIISEWIFDPGSYRLNVQHLPPGIVHYVIRSGTDTFSGKISIR